MKSVSMRNIIGEIRQTTFLSLNGHWRNPDLIKKISHVGIAVSNMNESLKLYSDILGLKVTGVETVEEQKVKSAMIPIGESRIELMESTDPEGPVGKFIAKRGEGIHHISLEVDDIEKELAKLSKAGVELIDKKPRVGADGKKIAFVHPRSTHGVLLELSSSK
jgi:lactoylglutathione lyase/methylmalonyl-CoA/ethylmalonyl-CoA epimerase